MGSRIGQCRWRKAVAAALLATHLTACHTWRVETVPPAQLFATNPPSEVRVTRADSSTVVLHTPGVVRDSLWGSSRGAQLSMPLTDVRAIATRRADAGKTFLLGVGMVGASAAMISLLCAATHCTSLD